MKRSFFAALGISAAVFAGPIGVAGAADMAVKAPVPAPVAATDWSGLTLDADIGWERSGTNWLYVNFPGEITFPLSSTDGDVGVHAGYQQQFGWLVIGGEVGISSTFTDKFASVTSVGVPVGTACGTGVAGQQCQTNIGSVATAGGKLGVAWQDWLLYGVGGGARASVNSQLVQPTGLLFDTTTGGKVNGYYAGGGVDYIFNKTRLFDMIVGVEYEHIGLGTAFLTSSADAFAPGGVNARNVGAKEDIVWGKLTLKFNPWAR